MKTGKHFVVIALLLIITAGNMISCGKTPKTAEEFFDRGLAYNEKGKYNRAIADYEKALKINPKLGSAKTNLIITTSKLIFN